MAVRMQHPGKGGIYFITFTLYKWNPLFQITGAYDAVYKWFDHLYTKGASVNGFVIMPNHLHALLYFSTLYQSLNTIIGNAKRFMAYEISSRLEQQKEELLLEELYGAVKKRERAKGQRYRVFEESFDAKPCYSQSFIEQKLHYMHLNPVRGKWQLVEDFALYPHSSAGFYQATGASLYKKIVHISEVGGKAVL